MPAPSRERSRLPGARVAFTTPAHAHAPGWWVSRARPRLGAGARETRCTGQTRPDPGARRAKLEAAKGECEHMTFTVGDTVVYPHHGAALIEQVSKRIIRGEEKLYLRLKVAQGDLTIDVPADNADLVDVRGVVGEEGLENVFDALRAQYIEERTNWSRCYKANVEMIASGDVIKVAEVFRVLSRLESVCGRSAGEKRMLVRAC